MAGMKQHILLSLLTTGVLAFCNSEYLNDTEAPVLSFPTSTDDGRLDARRWLSPEYRWFFEYPLPIPPVKEAKFTYTNTTSGAAIDYYEVEVKSLQKQVYPDLPPTNLVGYDGLQPGPTFMMYKGREAVVRFINSSPTNVSVHVHGQYNRAPFDGWAADYAYPGQYKDYHYPNGQNARTIWYHDHTEFETGENVYMGQDGFYILSDDDEQALNLPSGDYDIPLSICAKQYGDDGQLVYDTNGNNGLPGDVIQVNGQPWPYLAVEPRKYRLRLLNGAVSRAFMISFHNDQTDTDVNFNVIASDAGLFPHPIQTTNLSFSMGERYEVILDFTPFASQNITMHNALNIFGNPDFAATDRILRFTVSDTITDSSNNGPLPSTLRPLSPPFPSPQTNISKSFTFARTGEHWTVNGVGWADIENRILTRPVLGADEIWVLRNANVNGEGIHPVHIHLVDFQILDRTGGSNTVLPYEGAGMKDVVWLGPGEEVRVLARYAPWEGVYMFHCHNLVHEDHDMLVAFNVTQLEKWGYDADTVFIDPMAPEFRPKDVNEEDFTDEKIREKLEWFWGLDAYDRRNRSGNENGRTRRTTRWV